MPDCQTSIWMRKPRLYLNWPWDPPEELQVACGKRWRSMLTAKVLTCVYKYIVCLKREYNAFILWWTLMDIWLNVPFQIIACPISIRSIVAFCCIVVCGSRMGEFRRRFAADCLSLQSSCSSEAYWAAEWGLLAGQVSNISRIFTEMSGHVHFILKHQITTFRLIFLNWHF